MTSKLEPFKTLRGAGFGPIRVGGILKMDDFWSLFYLFLVSAMDLWETQINAFGILNGPVGNPNECFWIRKIKDIYRVVDLV